MPAQPLGRIRHAMGSFRYLLGPTYCRAVLRGGLRDDLDGNPRREMTSKEQARARRDLMAQCCLLESPGVSPHQSVHYGLWSAPITSAPVECGSPLNSPAVPSFGCLTTVEEGCETRLSAF